MAGDLNIRAEIEYVLKDQGINAAVDKIHSLETAQKGLTVETKRSTAAAEAFGGALRTIGQYAASFLGAGAIISFLRSSQREFIDAERSAFRLQMSLRLLGSEYADSYGAVSAYADELERLTGVDADVIRSAQAVLVTIGRLSGETLNRATRAALDLSAALGTDLNNAAMILAKAGAGAEGALARMGIKIGDGVDASQRLEEILAALEKRVGGVAYEMGNTLPGSVDKATTAFGNFKENVGKLFTDSTVTTVFKEFFDAASYEIDRLIAKWGIIKDILSYVRGGSPGEPPPVPTRPEGLTYEVNVSLKAADEQAKAKEEAEAKARAEREKQEKESEERIAKFREESFKSTLERELELNQRAIEARAEQASFEEDLNKSVFDRLDARIETAEQVVDIEIESNRKALEANKASLEEWYVFEQRAIATTVRDEQIKNAKLLALDKEYYAKKKALAEMTEYMIRMASIDAFAAGVEILGSVFGKYKAFAVAQAIIDTWRSVNAIMADPNVPILAKPALVAAATAQGLAMVAKIQATSMGSGSSGGGGGHGFGGGQKLARASGSGGPAQEPTGPYTQTTAATPGGGTTIDNRNTGTTIVVNGPVVGGRAGVKELYRMLEEEGRSQRSRLVR